MILESIKAQTLANHTSLEQTDLLLPFSRREIDHTSYQLILKKFYGYFYPLEKQIDTFLPLIRQFLPDYLIRRKADRLWEDLQNITTESLDKSSVELCIELPEVKNESQAFGCLYVIEGSTLGGRLISKIILECLGFTPKYGASYFYGYGPETGSRWKLFGEALVNFSQQRKNDDEIIRAANSTFSQFEKWLRM